MEPAQQSSGGPRPLAPTLASSLARSLVFARRNAPCSATIAVRFAVQPGRPLLCKVTADSEIRTHQARVWLTREQDDWDYWLQPGDCVRVLRGERIWLSTDDNIAAELTLTREYRAERVGLVRWWSRLCGLRLA